MAVTTSVAALHNVNSDSQFFRFIISGLCLTKPEKASELLFTLCRAATDVVAAMNLLFCLSKAFDTFALLPLLFFRLKKK